MLPHERTHAGPKEGRLRLLRAARAQLEPIFLLYEGDSPSPCPTGRPTSRSRETRLWRIADDGIADAFADRQLLIADGHHRYETALAYAAEAGLRERPDDGRARLDRRPRAGDLPHAPARPRHDDALPPVSVGDSASPAAAVDAPRRTAVRSRARGRLPARVSPSRSRRAGRARRRARRPPRRPRGLLHGRARRGDRGASTRAKSDGAFLLRPPRIEDVFERAAPRRGDAAEDHLLLPEARLCGLLFPPV